MKENIFEKGQQLLRIIFSGQSKVEKVVSLYAR